MNLRLNQLTLGQLDGPDEPRHRLKIFHFLALLNIGKIVSNFLANEDFP